MQTFSWRQFVWRSLTHHRRVNLAVALGVAAATAVLTGALLIGDSMRGSLRRLTLERLGRIDELLIADRFFRADLVESLVHSPGFEEYYSAADGTILLPNCTIEWTTESRAARASNVMLLGVDQEFWRRMGDPSQAPPALPGEDEVIINAPLAAELGVAVGDQLVIRLPQSSQIPADSSFGRRDDNVRSLVEFTIIDILPVRGLGRFSLNPSQMQPSNVFMSLAVVQDALKQEDKINAILVAGKHPQNPPDAEASAALSAMLHPSLEDYGLSLPRVERRFVDPATGKEEVIFDYFNLTSDRMVIPPEVEMAAEQALASNHAQPAFTYLATSIEPDGAPEKAIPYSTITAIDSTPQLGPLMDDDGRPLAWNDDDEIVLTRWAAEDLQVRPGDRVRVRYFSPETTHGEVVELSDVFTLRDIAPLTEPDEPYTGDEPPKYVERPALTNDPDLTPTVEGITDSDTIDNWDAPFPYDRNRLRQQDRDYWDNHRTTPKAYIGLSAGEKLWGSRFGHATSIRVPAGPQVTRESLTSKLLTQLRRDNASLGFQFLPVKRQGLAASAGTTPFDVLFLALSSFIIAASLMLVALLFRLGVDLRSGELGILLALGWSRRRTSRLQMMEGVLVAALGAASGAVVGVGYAWLMLVGLRSRWLGAVTTAFLHLYVTPRSLILGYACGVIVSVLTIWWSIRQTRRLSQRQLLSGQTVEATLPTRASGWGRLLPLALLLAALGLAFLATMLGGEIQAGAFVGGGALVLAAILTALRRWMRRGAEIGLARGSFPLARLAGRNASRNPSRSTTTIGLMATATFLIVAMSAFRLAPTDAGSGGFDLVAESSLPIYQNLNQASVREELLGGESDVLAGGHLFALRMKPGDDASCRNLFRSTRPRVLGVTPEFIQHFASANVQHFAWAASDAKSEAEHANPWLLLNRPAEDPNVVPMILDKNTAMYSLQMYGGIGEEKEFVYEDGQSIRFRVVGLLSNSIFQGSLLIGESRFQARFPRINGYRFFLIQTPPGEESKVASVLEDRLGDQGFDATRSRKILEDLLAVQNTYLSAFQSLGALGLLLGGFGLAAVQLRNVLERRAEMALMRAAGFSRRRLAEMVLLENVSLLLGGLATGVVAALVAVLPHMLIGGASIPLGELGLMLSVIFLAGLLAGLLAIRATLKAPLVAALRGD